MQFRLILCIAAVAATAISLPVGRARATESKPAAGAKCQASALTAAEAAHFVAQEGSPCKKCPDDCKSYVTSCKDGSVKACYQAAACLCRCNLEAGGCGSDKEALRKCVDENERSARDLEQ
jgi:hypothetical protein